MAHKFILLFVMAFVAISGISFAGGEAELGDEAVTFRIGNGAEPESLDPHLVSGVPEHRIFYSLFEGLVTNDPQTNEAVPGVAERWDISDDRTVYTFYLRRTTWSDGVPITAQTVYDSWIRVLDPETASPYAWFPGLFISGADEYNGGEAGPDVVGIRVVDDYTFEVQLAGPLPYALGALTHYSFGIVPLHAIEEHGTEWTLAENFVGNGPFMLEEWLPQQQLSVVPNPLYWDADAVSLDRVVYLPIEDNNTGYNMFLNGELDWQTTVPNDQVEQARLEQGYNRNAQLATYYYHLNNKRPPLDDERVRKALAISIDRNELVETVTRAGQIPAYGIVPALSGYEATVAFQEDTDQARRLLEEAGFPGGEGFPELQILYNTSEGHKKIAEYIQQQWKEILGIDVSLINQEWKTYLSTTREHDFDIARAGWVGDYQDPNTFLDLFITDGGLNNSDYSNPRYDELIERASSMSAGSQRFNVLREAEELFIGEDHGIIPIYYYVTLNMIDTNKWGGWYKNVQDFHPTKDIYRK